MKNLFEVSGTYGSQHTQTTVLVYENRDGSKWYCCEDSTNVNCTYDDIVAGVDVEELSDFDAFTTMEPIQNLEELEIAVES